MYPVDAVRHLRAVGATGRLVTPFESGEFLAWALRPAMSVSIDGRFEEVYTREELLRWLRFNYVPEGAERAEYGRWAREQGVDWVLLPVALGRGAARSLELSGLWQLVLSDERFLLYGRVDSAAARPALPRLSAPAAGVSTVRDFFTLTDLERFSRP
jgi:hypothetical protein